MQINNLQNTGSRFKTGYVAIIGEPNVGKSTLMNALVGQKISAVTDKPQTTRHKISGILSDEKYQIIFLDTPGLLKPRYLLHDAMMRSAYSALEDADVVIFMIDASNPDSFELSVLPIIKILKKSTFLVINKTDIVKKNKILELIGLYSGLFPFQEIFPISALKSVGTGDLLNSIVSTLPEHPPYYPLDLVSGNSERFFVGEIIREKIFEKFRKEVPYSTTVDVMDFREKSGRKDLIRADIYVERESQKSILIGRKGAALKEIGELARKDIEQFLQREVYLELFVKVREKWRDKRQWLKQFGYTS